MTYLSPSGTKHMSIADRLELAEMCVKGTPYATVDLDMFDVVVKKQKADAKIQCGNHLHANAYDKDTCEALKAQKQALMEAEVYDSASEAKAATQKASDLQILSNLKADSLEILMSTSSDPAYAYAETLCEFLNQAHPNFRFKISTGGKIHKRVYRQNKDYPLEGQVAYCFVDAAGNIRKPAGWAQPAAGVRSTVSAVIHGDVKTDWAGGWLYAK